MIFLLDAQKVSQILRVQPLAAAAEDEVHRRVIAVFSVNRSSDFQQLVVQIKAQNAEFLERETKQSSS